MTSALLTKSVRCVRTARYFIAALLVLEPAAHCWADAINLSSFATISGSAAENIIIRPPGDDGHFDLGSFNQSTDSLGPVSLTDGFPVRAGSLFSTITSVVQPSGIHVNASTSARVGAARVSPRFFEDLVIARAAATFQASFTLTQPHRFESLLSATDGICAKLTGTALASFSCLDPGVATGTLNPGTYQFSIGAFSNAFAIGTTTASDFELSESQFDAAFTLAPLTPTPEPATSVLLATGIIALMPTRRQRKTDKRRHAHRHLVRLTTARRVMAITSTVCTSSQHTGS